MMGKDMRALGSQGCTGRKQTQSDANRNEQKNAGVGKVAGKKQIHGYDKQENDGAKEDKSLRMGGRLSKRRDKTVMT